MTYHSQEFNEPFNWCDRCCERCPLAESCAVHRRGLGQRWQHEARGEDPDDPAVFMRDIEQELGRALALVQRVAAAEGIELHGPARQPRVVPLDAARLRAAGAAVADNLGALRDVEDNDAVVTGFVIAVKCARLATHLGYPEDEQYWRMDVIANLLLLERLRADLLEQLEHCPLPVVDATRRALDKLGRTLAPLSRMIDDRARRMLAAKVERGEAPSPFCRVAS